MIKSIQLLSNNIKKSLDFTQIHEHKIVLDDLTNDLLSFTLKIEFNHPIVLFRNHDYTWVDVKERRLANWFSPKLLKLKNNQIVQANQNLGIWEVTSKKSNVLYWRFNPENANPIANYDSNNSKGIIQAVSEISFDKPLSLLFPNYLGIEVSRSKLSFSAIACFTDHCDFDTLNNLIQQRHFFKEHNIKVTKGFFLNHYSKREDTASVELNRDELEKWIKDGHELAYHSLSQSLKTHEESFKDFLSFKPPFKDITTWIDHGFQPYNFTNQNCKEDIKSQYGSYLRSRDIKQLWNYIDSGTAYDGVINQINHNHFTLKAYYYGIKQLSFKTAFRLMLKNVIFNYSNDEYGISLYRSIAIYAKSFKVKKKAIKHIYFVINIIKLIIFFIPVLLFWRYRRGKVYPLSEFTPIFFEHIINGETFTIFQTLEMINFKRALHKNNIELLIKEKGLFIAHTYFSAPMDYHEGKLFNKKDKIDEEVNECFQYLAKKIATKDIWNPTLSELITYIKKLQDVIFDCNDKGEIFVKNRKELLFREVL